MPSKPKPAARRPRATVAPAAKPQPEVKPPDREKEILTARIDALLDQIGDLERRIEQQRVERQALARALNAMERDASERNAKQQHATGKELTTMPTLGEIVTFQPKIDAWRRHLVRTPA